MMNKFKNGLSRKILAALLAALLIRSAVPVSVASVFAATEAYPDYVTVTVTDESGNALAGATVNFSVNSKSNGDNYIQKEEKTDSDGCVKIMPSGEFAEGDLTLTAAVSKEKYHADSIEAVEITASDQNFDIALVSLEITDVVVTEASFTYDKNPHKAFTVEKRDTDKVFYSVDGAEFTEGIPEVTDVGIYSYTVRIEREGYEPFVREVTAVVNRADMTDITLEEKTLTYNEIEQDLVTVRNILDTDKVTYEVNGEVVDVETGKVPTASAVGNYNVKITVDRGNNYNPYTNTVTSTIGRDEIDLGELKVKGLEGVYTGIPQEAVNVTGKDDKYTLMYRLNDGEWQNTIPLVTEAGSYTVLVKATVNNNYEDSDVDVEPAESAVYPFNVYIAKVHQYIYYVNGYGDSQNTSVSLDSQTQEYDFSAEGGNTDKDIVYSVSNVSNDGVDIDEIAEINSETGILTIKSAGCIKVTATKPEDNNYEAAEVSHYVFISVPGNGLVNFNSVPAEYVFGANNGTVSDAEASNTNSDDYGALSYSIDKTDIGLSCNSEKGKIQIDDYGKLSEALDKNSGELAVTATAYKGEYKVPSEIKNKPSKPENTIAVYFSDANKWGQVYCHYWTEDSATEWPGEKMTCYAENIYQQSVYRLCIPDNVKGIVFSNGTDEKKTLDITTNIYDDMNFFPKSADNICATGSVKWEYEPEVVEKTKYAEDKVSYTVIIRYAQIPENSYTLSEEKGDNGWYNSAVTVTPKEGYMISESPVPENFADKVVIDKQGTGDRYVYLRNTETDGITSKIKLEDTTNEDNKLKIDTIAPNTDNMKIEFENVNIIKQIAYNLGILDPMVTVTFTVEDEFENDGESGLQGMSWGYGKDGAIVKDEDYKSLDFDFVEKAGENGKGAYVATLTLPESEAEQYRGNISFKATDNAGNTSDVKTEDTVLVIDTISPQITALHQLVASNGTYNPIGDTHYYSGDVEFMFTVEEANFFEEDFKVQLTKDGGERQDVTLSWEHKDETHTGTFIISGDGDYKVYLTDFSDRSENSAKDENGNEIHNYVSDTITIDTTKPVLDFKFNQADQSAKFIVKEHNFRPSGISVDAIVKDIDGKEKTVDNITDVLQNEKWKPVEGETDTYEFVTDKLANGIYNYKISYEDIVGWTADDLSPDAFTVDHSIPYDLDISYSKPITESILSTLTLGFYNPSVDVTFTAKDDYAGVDYFEWSYLKQEGASGKNVNTGAKEYTGQTVNAVQDTKDKYEFTATITLPKSEADQLRGYISVIAVDKYGNESEKKEDSNKQFAVDTKSPIISSSHKLVDSNGTYNPIGETHYYSGDVEFKFTVEEANFFEEDFKVQLTKDGGQKQDVTLDWTHDDDTHTGTFTIGGDGDYKVYLTDFSDRSNNSAKDKDGNKIHNYVSDTITIDTTKPELDFEFNQAEQSVRFIVKEHNFLAKDIKDISVAAVSDKLPLVADINGNEITVEDINKELQNGTWEAVEGKTDTYYFVTKDLADGIYNYKISYTDAAGNKADDISPEAFTIDHSSPFAPQITYSTPINSTSITDSILSALTLGFYNPKTDDSSVNITFTSHDSFSGVDYFKWSYSKQQGESSVNIDAGDKEYTEQTVDAVQDTKDKSKYTATVTLPKSEADQLRGSISAYTTDNYNNVSEVTNDAKNVVIVDSISPEMTAEYSPTSRTVDNVMYYGKDKDGKATITFKVTEANFFADDVKVSVSKNGGKKTAVTPSWTDTSVDEHIGTYTISGDGHYVVYVTYTDRSKNIMDSYTSDMIVIDTVSPEMTTDYSSASRTVGSTMYYGSDKSGKATVTFNITETNFFAEDVKVSVSKNGGEREAVMPSWKDKSVDEHVGTYTLSGDGHYIVYVTYTDRSNNEMKSYISDMITIDTVKPVIKVEYLNKDVIEKLSDSENHKRNYYDAKQTTKITITEHNFNSDEVDFSKIIAKDVTGKKIDINKCISYSSWSDNGDVHEITITYSNDANYTFDVDYADLADNKADNYSPDYFTVDTKAPTVTNVEYSESVQDTVIGDVSYGFYGAKMRVTVTAFDETSGVHEFVYNYRNADNVSGVNAELINQAIKEGSITYSSDRKTATLVFEIPKEALGSNNQFNGTVDFTASDRSHNVTQRMEDHRVVVDNIAPLVQVDYNTPVNTAGNISYYDGNITGTITIDEANFYSQDIDVTYTKDGGSAGALPVEWSDDSVDVHKGTFRITGDGDYTVKITYTDKSGNEMQAYTSDQLTIDTKIDAPAFTINGEDKKEDNGGAYKDDVNVGFNYSDQNFDSRKITLTRTRFKEIDKDVTEQFLSEDKNGKGGSGSFSIPEKVENDGIYTLTVSMTDKANHSVESYVKFTVNRFGSVYEYDDYLVSLIKDGGQYITISEGNEAAVTEDLIITEYNADKIVKDSLNILITRDGEAIDAVYSSNPKINDKAKIGDSGWYQYTYTVSKDNFKEDGEYKITLSSKDATKNASTSVPENSIDAKGNSILDDMEFTVDTTAPEIRNVINLDKAIINAQKVNVKYSLVDVYGLSSVEIFVDGKSVDSITDFEDKLSFTGEFTISEKAASQTVRIKVTDLAGNVTDTGDDSFDPGDLYVFYDTVTVSTNFFVRWFANKPLFFVTIGAFVLILVGVGVLIAVKSKKRKADTE